MKHGGRLRPHQVGGNELLLRQRVESGLGQTRCYDNRRVDDEHSATGTVRIVVGYYNNYVSIIRLIPDTPAHEGDDRDGAKVKRSRLGASLRLSSRVLYL